MQMIGPGAMQAEFVVTNPLLEKLGGLPGRATEGAAGMDLRACIEDQVTLAPGQTYRFDLGFAMHIANPSVAALILPRSGLGSRGLVLANTIGLIDSDYTGPIVATALNRNSACGEVLTIKPGDRIFQLVFIPVVLVEPIRVSSFSGQSERGAGGFGSTGSS